MRIHTLRLALVLGVLVVPMRMVFSDRGVRDTTPRGTTAPYLTASRIFAAGDGAIVIDADSGSLIKTDKMYQRLGQLRVGVDAGLMTFDAATQTAFVADRGGDRLLVVDTGTMGVRRSIKTPIEPYGVALMPDKKAVLVTTIADRALVAYDVSTGVERWRVGIAPEPRGLAISPDGRRAVVSHLTNGAFEQIDLVAHTAERIALPTPPTPPPSADARQSPRPIGFPRVSFAATYVGPTQAIVPFQYEVPDDPAAGYYGAGGPPVTQQLAFLGADGDPAHVTAASISVHQARAMTWDGARELLYVAGLGSDSIVQIRNPVESGIAGMISTNLRGERCGPDGLAVAVGGDVLVWCSFTRSIQRVEFVIRRGEFTSETRVWAGPSLVESHFTPQQHDGLVMFHIADPATSRLGSVACSSCHPDNRTDALTWRTDRQQLVQTPILAGRVVGTQPYKWDGSDKTLTDSMTSTMRRLGGRGLDAMQTGALVAYVESLPQVRAPARDAARVQRGKALFESSALGCRSCHDGDTFQDNSHHKFGNSMVGMDTPSLRGLAASAPYYHDGSAATLDELLRDRGSVHAMADMSKLTDEQIQDLTAFLETL